MKADCHMHMVLDGLDWKASIARHKETPHENTIRAALALYEKQGYTYLRDGGDRWGVGVAVRKIAPEYGITYRTPLAPLCKVYYQLIYFIFCPHVYSSCGFVKHQYVRVCKQPSAKDHLLLISA